MTGGAEVTESRAMLRLKAGLFSYGVEFVVGGFVADVVGLLVEWFNFIAFFRARIIQGVYVEWKFVDICGCDHFLQILACYYLSQNRSEHKVLKLNWEFK